MIGEKEDEPLVDAKQEFDFDLIRKYPRSNKRLQLAVATYGLSQDELEGDGGSQTQFISPYGIEFKSADDFSPGTLLKIHITVPDYWTRKQKFVDYARIDTPRQMKVLAKVVKSEGIGKRGKKKMITAQTIIMDEVDEQVLKTFLQEG